MAAARHASLTTSAHRASQTHLDASARLLAQGKPKAALRGVQAHLANLPGEHHAHVMLAQAQLALGDARAAQQGFMTALTLGDKSAAPYQGFGRISLRAGAPRRDGSCTSDLTTMYVRRISPRPG